MRKILLLSILLAGTSFANEEGGELHEESCVRCHEKRNKACPESK